jgi:hypothetical protein
MVRTAIHKEREMTGDIRLVISAKTIHQLRHGQSILTPAPTGASMATDRIRWMGAICAMRREHGEPPSPTRIDGAVGIANS